MMTQQQLHLKQQRNVALQVDSPGGVKLALVS